MASSRVALDNALKHDAHWWLQEPTVFDDKGRPLNLASAVIQGVIQPADLNLHVPQLSNFSKLKIRVAIVKKLVASGSAPRLARISPPKEYQGSAIERVTELSNWAQNGYSPSKAFLNRHPAWKETLSPLARSALFDASSPEVFEKLVKAGIDPAIFDSEGRSASVFQLDRAQSEAAPIRELQGWARICALQLGKKTIPPDALGVTEGLGALAPISVTLMRAWLKRTASLPSRQQVVCCIFAAHYLLVRDWVAAGYFDNDKSLQQTIWRSLHEAIEKTRHNTSEATARQVVKLLEVISDRPAWNETIKNEWKFFWTGRTDDASQPLGFSLDHVHHFTFDRPHVTMDALKETLAARDFVASEFSPFEQGLLLHVASASPRLLLQAIPNKASLALKTQFFWDLFKPSSDGQLNGARNRFHAARHLAASSQVSPDFGFTLLPPDEVSARVSHVKKLASDFAMVQEISPSFFTALDDAALGAIVPIVAAGARSRL